MPARPVPKGRGSGSPELPGCETKAKTMKHHSILSLFVGLLGLGAATTSCEDMLTPDMDRYATEYSGKDTVYFYQGILSNVQDMVEQNILLGDIRSDLADTTMYSSDSIASIATFDRQIDGDNGLLNRAAYYKVINQCNFYLDKADVTAQKNNIRYMTSEYAQVLNIRAWTYLQLVQTYGRVPFITKPVDNANTGWETNPEAWATADNLVDLLRSDLVTAKAYEYNNENSNTSTYKFPNYGPYKTGGTLNIPSANVCFYSDIILGDLYLLRGAGQSDYVNAATCYHNYLVQNKASVATGAAATVSERGFSSSNKTYSYSTDNWISSIFPGSSLGTDVLTVAPSAANGDFGKVLDSSVQIYGFDPTSSNSTTTDDSSTGESTTTSSGQVSLKINYKSRQIAPSQAYINLSQSQLYTKSTISNSVVTNTEYYEKCGDARLMATAPYFTTNNGTERYVIKEGPASVGSNGYASGASFKYYKTLYRNRQVYLRYAEAINRAGFPRMAYAVLRDGLNYNKMPLLMNDSIRYNADSTEQHRVCYLETNATEEAYNTDWIGIDELRRAAQIVNTASTSSNSYLDYLDFFSEVNKNTTNGGIHSLGSGTSTVKDSLCSYQYIVAQRMLDEAARLNGGIVPSSVSIKAAALINEWSNPATSQDEESTPKQCDEDEVNAVETLILDEMALETAFEGTRMADLIRVARHKNTADGSGNEWLAWKIARRSLNCAPYANVTDKGNSRLYNLLLTPDNWYLRNPEY